MVDRIGSIGKGGWQASRSAGRSKAKGVDASLPFGHSPVRGQETAKGAKAHTHHRPVQADPSNAARSPRRFGGTPAGDWEGRLWGLGAWLDAVGISYGSTGLRTATRQRSSDVVPASSAIHIHIHIHKARRSRGGATTQTRVESLISSSDALFASRLGFTDQPHLNINPQSNHQSIDAHIHRIEEWSKTSSSSSQERRRRRRQA